MFSERERTRPIKTVQFFIKPGFGMFLDNYKQVNWDRAI